MFVQSVEFIRAHANGNSNGGKAKAGISIYGQESNYTTQAEGGDCAISMSGGSFFMISIAGFLPR